MFKFGPFSPHQWTPLHSAAFNNRVDVMQYLIGVGADLSIKDNSGVSE